MAVTTRSQEIKVRVSAKRFFKALTTESYDILPKANPSFKSVQKLQGDGGVGTIRQANFLDGNYIKHRIDAIDSESKVSKFTVIEGGGVGVKFESISHTHKFEGWSDGGCILKITTEYHHKGDAQVKDEDIKVQDPKFFTLVEDYLVANPQVCV